jgi:MoxR-like ATPase
MKVGDRVKLVGNDYDDTGNNPIWGGVFGKIAGTITDIRSGDSRPKRIIVVWDRHAIKNSYKVTDLALIEEAEKMTEDTPKTTGSIEIYTEKEIKLEQHTLDSIPEEHRIYIPKEEFYLNTGYLKAIGYGIKKNRPTLLIGDAGCGKTASIRHMGHLLQCPVRRVNLNGSTTVDEFVGKWKLDGGNMIWEDGILTKCVRYGWWIVNDEINACLPEIAFVLHALLDDDRMLVLTQKGDEIIKAHANFRFFGTMNPDYAGTHRLNEAFLDRFLVVEVDYPKAKEETEILAQRTGLKDKRLLSKMVQVANKAREEYRQMKISSTFSTRKLIDWATAVEIYTPAQAFLLEVVGKLPREDRNIFRDIASAIFSEPEFRNVLELKLGKREL